MRRLALLTLIGLAACISPVLSGPADQTWRLVALDKRPATGAFLQVTMTLGPDGLITGKAPCNGWSARNLRDFPVISPGPVTATEMACDALADEMRIFQALAGAEGSVDQDGVLILYGAGGEVMEFHPATRFLMCRTCLHIRLPPSGNP